MLDEDIGKTIVVVKTEPRKAFKRGWYVGGIQMAVFVEFLHHDAPWWILLAVVIVNILFLEVLKVQWGYSELKEKEDAARKP